MPPLWPWVAKNENTTTTRPVSGPTERSIAAGQQHDQLAERDQRERGRQQQHRCEVEAAQEAAVRRAGVGAERRRSAASEHDGRQVVAGGEPAHAQRAPRAGRQALARRGGGDRRAGDVLLGDRVALERARRSRRARTRAPGRRAPAARPRRTRGRRPPCRRRRRRAAAGRARCARRRRRRASARRRAGRSARASSERANSTFCWLPPESDETGVSARRRLDAQPLDLAVDDRALAAGAARSRGARPRRARAARCSRAPTAAASALRRGGRREGARRRPAGAAPGRRARAAGRAARPCPARGSRPASARRNSRWPLPSTPARPTISPAATSRSTSRKRGPLSPCVTSSGSASVSVRLVRENLVDGAPDDQAQDLGLGDVAARERAACLAVAEDGDPVGDLLAPRAGGARCRRRRCPAAVIERMRSNRRAVSAGVSDSVGSSSTSTFDSSASAFAISSNCRSAMLSSLDARGRIDVRPDRFDLRPRPRRRVRNGRPKPPRHREDHVLGTVRSSRIERCW